MSQDLLNLTFLNHKRKSWESLVIMLTNELALEVEDESDSNEFQLAKNTGNGNITHALVKRMRATTTNYGGR
jgi:hypothetical protein